MGALPTSRLMTVAEFEVLAEQSDKRLELVQGEVIEKEVPKFRHQWVQRRLYELLRSAGSPKFLLFVELQFRPAPEFNLLQVDIGGLTEERCSAALSAGYVEGAPNLMIEVLSPSNIAMDLNRRRNLCFAEGCQEFWIVDPRVKAVEVWTPDSTGRLYTEADEITSALFPAAKLPVSQIFA